MRANHILYLYGMHLVKLVTWQVLHVGTIFDARNAPGSGQPVCYRNVFGDMSECVNLYPRYASMTVVMTLIKSHLLLCVLIRSHIRYSDGEVMG